MGLAVSRTLTSSRIQYGPDQVAGLRRKGSPGLHRPSEHTATPQHTQGAEPQPTTWTLRSVTSLSGGPWQQVREAEGATAHQGQGPRWKHHFQPVFLSCIILPAALFALWSSRGQRNDATKVLLAESRVLLLNNEHLTNVFVWNGNFWGEG